MGIVGKAWNRADVDTSASVILDLANRQLREFLPSAVIDGARTWVLQNTNQAFEFLFRFTISGGPHVQTMPNDFEMADVRWNPATFEWTPIDDGNYEARGRFDGTTWYVTITDLYD